MGLIQRDITVTKGDHTVFIELALIDTGSDFTILPLETASSLNIHLDRKHTELIQVADGRGTLLYGPYRANVEVDGYRSNPINIYFWSSPKLEAIVGHNFMQSTDYTINYNEEIPSNMRIKKVRYLRKIYPRNAPVPQGEVIRKPKKIDGYDWMVDAYRDKDGKIRYRKLYIIL